MKMDSPARETEPVISVGKDVSHADAGFLGLVDEAKVATEQEHQMSLWQGLRLYPKAVGWSVLLSTAIIMEGYGKSPYTNQFSESC